MPPEIAQLDVAAYTIPTDGPESDGTLRWSETTMVVAVARAEGVTGLGYTYAAQAAAELISGKLAEVVVGTDALSPPHAWTAMRREVRNVGRRGVASTAISAVDVALWDLKARLLGVSLLDLLGAVRDGVEGYASGGFTSSSPGELRETAEGWLRAGYRDVKIKVGREPDRDVERVQAVRDAVGPDVGLVVDANGAYDRKQALRLAERFAELGVSWLEEPVSSEDLEGLRLLRDRVPAPIEIAAGEYGYDLFDFRALLLAGAVDVLQADATRCEGITGLLRVGALCDAFCIPLSAHTAPSLHAHPCCALPSVRHVEVFHDHVRIEQMLLDGALDARDGVLRPDRSRPGHGLALRTGEAERYRVHGKL